MRLLALLFFALAFPAVAAPEQWIYLKTPHFEMYTSASERRAREVILYFEEIRSFFLQKSPVRGVTEFPVRIIAFRNAKQYEPYRPNDLAAAFYTKGRYRDYIVLGDMDPEHLPAAIHEYMHLVVEHSGIQLPLWLNEGWADVYSTLKPMGKKSMIGDLIPGRMQVLTSGKWLPFDALTAVRHDSPSYNEKDRVGIFYSESWALTHMLYLDPDYAPNFRKFILAFIQGANTEQACQTAFGKTGAEVFTDLQLYLTRRRFYGAMFEVKLSKSEEEAAIEQASDFDTAIMSADLLAALNKIDRARAAYEQLAVQYPARPEIPQSLGYLAWQNQNIDEARKQFRKAFDAGSKDPQLCFHLATFELQNRDSEAKAIPALQRALQLKPDYRDARLELGMAELNAKQYAAAIADLKQLSHIEPERAGRFFNALAYGYTQTGNFSEARKQADAAIKWGSDQEKDQAQSLLRYLDTRAKMSTENAQQQEVFEPSQQEGPPRLVRAIPAEAVTFHPPVPDAPRNPFVAPDQKLLRAEGIAKELACEGGLQFTILSGGRTLTFAIPKPDQVLLKHKSDIAFDFNCGPQQPFAIAVEYVPAAQPGRVAGDLKSMEF